MITPWLIVLAGVAFGGIGVLAARTDLARSADWPQADAVVVRTFDHGPYRRGPRYSYALRFERADGVAESKIESGRAKVGDVMRLRYNPRQPKEVVLPDRLERGRQRNLTIGAVVAGLGLLLVVLFPPPPHRRYSGYGLAATSGVRVPGD
jgi:hypothetical protein